MTLELKIGLDAISSYKRLAYTAWHAIAEFIDNSTQSYFDHRTELDTAFALQGDSLHVEITYDPKGTGTLRIEDNAMGMSYDDLQRALHVALPPRNTSGRSKYGMGLKTAACWLGNVWTVKTKMLGENVEHTIRVDVEKIASGENQLPYSSVTGQSLDSHYTIIEITSHNRLFQGRTLGKIKDYLRSMYRVDLRNGTLILKWQNEILNWEDIDERLLRARDDSLYKKHFEFFVDNKRVKGWVGILERGSRADAGFSILHYDRVIKGWPEAWRPTSLYGQIQGTNDLVNQRLIGEISLDEFDVSHTKDDILWLGTQEESIEEGLRLHCSDYRDIALKHRKSKDDQRGPSELETVTALDELKEELLSSEIADRLSIGRIPPEQVVAEAVQKVILSVTKNRAPTLHENVGGLAVKLYLEADRSPNDYYVTSEATKPNEVIVVVNQAHPHWGQLQGSQGVFNYLKHCTYDAIAEWQARSRASRIDPDTIKMLKDGLLRVSFEIEQHESE